MTVLERLSGALDLPFAYRYFRRIVGGESSTQTYLNQYVKPASGNKILDIGCGPADMLSYLPAVAYTGFDISPAYIEAARNRFGSRGRFLCGDVGLTTLEGEEGTFDLVLALGVLHHLNDAGANQLFALARRMLRPEGALVTYDGCLLDGQPAMARWLLAHDRGKFVRSLDGYLKLTSAHFSTVESHLRNDLLRVPYTHLIMRCCNGAASGNGRAGHSRSRL
jgi:SAM-dependent methyltransferase